MNTYIEQWKKEHAKEIEINLEIDKQKDYLRETDYIALKLAEAIASNDSDKLSVLKELYKEELIAREQARAHINNYERELVQTSGQ